ncbi:MAG: hypothetical protein PVI57_19060 [Gemmatimonadota bacterium]|jgi:DNA uptake protein ComE-like DNA-binding protein
MRRATPRPGVLIACALLPLAACSGEEAAESEPPESPAAEAAAEPAAGEAMAADEATEALIDPGTASREEMVGVAGIDDELADAIIANRPYDDMLAVDAVLAASLDEPAREEVYRHLWKPLDLNSALPEEILLIPGVGERMLHEFEEYRPYQALAEFRREIGKYVDDEEVARLERYVTIR